MTSWAQRIVAGDARAVARAATVIENHSPEADPLMRELFPHTGRAMVLGVTGAPGAGKSTLVDQMARALRREKRTVGIIAVDPTSPFSGGAVLGDRIRMQAHHDDPGVFIRSMATRGWHGGIARASADIALLMDAAGRDVVLVETVGVGQDEVEVVRLADATVVVLVPGMGDDVQALKAGLMEIADVFVINKADQPGAERLQSELEAYLGLAHRPDGWTPPIVRTIAPEGTGIDEMLAAVRGYLDGKGSRSRGKEMWVRRLREMLRERLLERLPEADLEAAAEAVAGRQRDPYSYVDEWLRKIRD
ncbi:MAG: methylmalonyl Co-A mutase-associated GTPase MeaB [Bryobacteraceae bacterium]